MANWTIQTPVLGLQPIEETSTVKKVPLGTIVTAVHQSSTGSTSYGSGEFIYLLGVASTAVGTWVTYNADDFSTTRLAANAIGPVAIAMSANVANQYGWYQISGKAIGLALSISDNDRVYATATAGSVDETVVDGDMVHLAKAASAQDVPSTGFAEFEIHRPYCDDTNSND